MDFVSGGIQNYGLFSTAMQNEAKSLLSPRLQTIANGHIEGSVSCL